MSRYLLLCVISPAVLAQLQPGAVSRIGSANLPAQEIGSNDLLAVSVYDAPELTRTVRVDGDGLIRLPMLKRRIQAEGLLPGRLEAGIAEALEAERILVAPATLIGLRWSR